MCEILKIVEKTYTDSYTVAMNGRRELQCLRSALLSKKNKKLKPIF